MFKVYKRYFDFEGRSSRSEYWLFVLLCVLVGLAYVAVILTQRAADPYDFNAVSMIALAAYAIFSLASLIPSLAVTVRRLHDTDRSGWLILLGLIPLIGPIILLVFYVQRGTRGPNKFGPDPLGQADAEVFA